MVVSGEGQGEEKAELTGEAESGDGRRGEKAEVTGQAESGEAGRVGW